MGFASEFKEFAVKGNVMDLAVGVIIGGAFGKIVDSAVKDLIMPLVGKVVGGLDFSNYFIKLGAAPADFKGPETYEALTKAGVPLFAYGNFLTILLNFVILAFVIFVMIREINKVKRSVEHVPPPAPSEPPAPPEDIVLLREIRDSLARRP
ncbi:large conductance mechanosensitive channel protein MscL [Pelomonas sp. KK5]|uniref:large conductance mechanosensitive channel protein MscL n=1 Tax=Pelomonas sp. KK5 TaxID=1855730 RepID=UPI00097C75FC|nr:large conductance mechanosensitive channel protein MscL [Pelomonas sp. KK5]